MKGSHERARSPAMRGTEMANFMGVCGHDIRFCDCGFVAKPHTLALKPSPALLCKLGSIAVHVDEMLSADGHAYDRLALTQLLADSDVIEWIGQMAAMAMVPRKRR